MNKKTFKKLIFGQPHCLKLNWCARVELECNLYHFAISLVDDREIIKNTNFLVGNVTENEVQRERLDNVRVELLFRT